MPFSSVLGASSVIKPGVCTSATRPTVPFEGQLIYETDTDRVASYNGSAWVYMTGIAAPPGLIYLTGASFTSQTSVAFANSIFTSTYDFYLVQLQVAADATSKTMSLQVRDNSGTKSAASYFGAFSGVGQTGSGGSGTANGATSFPMSSVDSANYSCYAITVSQPASSTKKTAWHGTGTVLIVPGTGLGSMNFGGDYHVDEAHTGLVFTFSGASTGSYKVYGYSNS